MESERARNTSFEPSAEGYLTVDFDLALTETKLSRWVDPTPFIPHDERRRAERCELILKMQADGLAKRLEHAHAKTAVIGISGGLDSCPRSAGGRPRHEAAGPPHQRCAGRDHALLRHHPPHPQQCGDLMRRAGRQLYRDRHRQHRPQPLQGHRPGPRACWTSPSRTDRLVCAPSMLMDTANRTGGLVVGTGDLSELALGWATYNGDHMSMYGVNARCPQDAGAPPRRSMRPTLPPPPSLRRGAAGHPRHPRLPGAAACQGRRDLPEDGRPRGSL